MVEGTKWWLFNNQIFSFAFFEDKEKKEKANTEASLNAMADAAETAPTIASAPSLSDHIVRGSNFFLTKEKDERSG